MKLQMMTLRLGTLVSYNKQEGFGNWGTKLDDCQQKEKDQYHFTMELVSDKISPRLLGKYSTAHARTIFA